MVSIVLVRHIRKHTNEKPYQCDKCDKRFSTRFGRTQHLKYQHVDMQENMLNKNTCEICHKDLATAQSLAVHMKIHRKVKAFTCSLCSKNFTTKSQLKAHSKTHDKKVFTTLYRKGSAGNVAETDSGVQITESGRNSLPSLKDPLLVTSAGVFRSVSSKSEHGFKCWDVGQDRAKYPCTKCNKKFKSSGYCRRHISSHSSSNLYQFNCSLCQKKFKTNVTLKCHILKHFRSERKFKCDDCPKTFTMKWHLKWHKSTSHTSTRPFMCPYCGKSFKLMYMCRRHIKTHGKDVRDGKMTDANYARLQTAIPEPESDAIAVGDAFSSLRIIPRPGGKSYGKEVTLIDADEMLKKKVSDTSFCESIPQLSSSQTVENFHYDEDTELANALTSANSSQSSTSDVSLQEHDYINWAGPALFVPSASVLTGEQNAIFHGEGIQTALSDTENIRSLVITPETSVLLPVHGSHHQQSGQNYFWNGAGDLNKRAAMASVVPDEHNFAKRFQNAVAAPIDYNRQVLSGQGPILQVSKSVDASVANDIPNNNTYQLNEISRFERNLSISAVQNLTSTANALPTDVAVDDSVPSAVEQGMENSIENSESEHNSFSLDFPNRTSATDIIILPNISQLSQKQPEPFSGVAGESTAANSHLTFSECINVSDRSEWPNKFKHACPDCNKSYPTTFQLKAHRVYTHNSSDVVNLSTKRLEISPVGSEGKSRGKPLSYLKNGAVRANGAQTKSNQSDEAWTLGEVYSKYNPNFGGLNGGKSAPRTRARYTNWQCDLCGLFFSSQSKLRTHFNSYHVMKPQCLSGSLSSTG